MKIFKKNLPQPTPYDTIRREMHCEMIEAMTVLKEATKATIIRASVVLLYPDGPDKDIAKADAKKQQNSLLNAIRKYDSLRNDYIQYVKKYADKFVTTADWPILWATSHDLVEKIYAEFLQKPIDK